MIFSNSTRRSGGSRNPAPIKTQSKRFERGRRGLLGGLAEIDQAACDVISERAQPPDLGIDMAAEHFGRELRQRGEIQEHRIDADGEHRFLCHDKGSVQLG